MTQKEILNNLHIGSIIKEIAIEKGISSQKIANTINLYQHNSDKIFKRTDMYVDDVAHISYLLEYNILDMLAKKYLLHIPHTDSRIESDLCLLMIDMNTLRVSYNQTCSNCNFLKETHISSHIKEVAQKKRWNIKDMANQLHCTPSMISYLYSCKTLKVKTLIRISLALNVNFIAEVYLSQMITDFSLSKFYDLIISIHSQQICITSSNDKTILMVFQRNDDKKNNPCRTKFDLET